ncbi:MAG TPA: Holliday junction resolvase RuvX [Balneolaceae bacterium]|nr:Holliday junction resolvase RuvX [Balneolaceae bacterium]
MSEKYGRILGVDVGTKWTGLARTDLLKTSANPIGTFPTEDVFEEIEKIVSSEKVEFIVVGWPLTPGGGEGRAVKMVKRFLRRLRKRLPAVKIEKFDERYSSKQAVNAMEEAGVPKTKRNDTYRKNQAAAAIILQEYLKEVVH